MNRNLGIIYPHSSVSNTLSEPLKDGVSQLTTYQRPNRPRTQRHMVQQFHPHVRREPGWWRDEEFVAVGGDVPFAQGSQSGRPEMRGIKRVEVDACELLGCGIGGEGEGGGLQNITGMWIRKKMR